MTAKIPVGAKEEAVTKQQLSKRVEVAHRLNQSALKTTERRGDRLDRAAQRSTRVVERAVRKLRTGSWQA
jgi:hypothetical protein